MKTNKKRILTAVIFIFLLLTTGTPATAQIIKINGGGVASGKAYIKTEIKGHKLTIRTPKITKNKYLKLVNVAL